MFKRLKEKISEEVKQSPLRQYSPFKEDLSKSSSSDVLSTTGPESAAQKNLIDLRGSNDECPPSVDLSFSIGSGGGDEDGGSQPTSPTPPLMASFENIDLSDNLATASPTSSLRRHRLSSVENSAAASSLFPIYSPAVFNHSVQSDLESASEVDDSSFNLDVISKAQLYQAFQKAKSRYLKYKSRYGDVIRAYKDQLSETDKIKSILTESQDKALRRISEMKEQSQLDQKAKQHLEEAFRETLDEKDELVRVLQTQVRLLKSAAVSPAVETAAATAASDDGKVQGEDGVETELTKKVHLQEDTINKLKNLLKSCKETITKQRESIEESEAEAAARAASFADELRRAAEKADSLERTVEDRAVQLAEAKRQFHEELEVREANERRLKAAIADLQADLEHKSNLISDLEAAAKSDDSTDGPSFDAQVDCLKASNEDLLKEVESLKSQTKTLDDECQSLTSHKKSLQTEVECLTSRWTNGQQEEDELRSQMDDLRTQVGSLMAKNESLEEEVGSLMSHKTRLQAEIDCLSIGQHRVADLEAAVEPLKAKCESLRNSNIALQAEVGSLTSQMESMASHVANGQQEVDDLKSQRENAMAEVGSLKAAVESLMSTNEILESGMKSLQGDCQSLNACKQTLQAEADTLSAQVASGQEREQALKCQKEALQDDVESLKQTNRALDLEVELSKVRVANLERELALGLPVQELAERTEGHRLELEELRQKHKDKLKELNQKFQTKLKNVASKAQKKQQEDKAEVEARVAEAERRGAELESQLAGKTDMVDTLRSKVIELESSMDDNFKTFQKDVEHLRVLQVDKSRLEAREKELEEIIEVCKKRHCSEVAALNDKCKCAFDELSKAKEDLKQLADQLNADKAELESDLEAKDDCVRRLQDQVTAAGAVHHQECSNLRSRIAELELILGDEQQRLHAELDELKAENQLKLNELTAQNERRLNELTLRKDRMEAEFEELTRALKAKEECVQQLQDQVTTAGANQDQQTSSLKNMISQQESRLGDEQERHTAELDELKAAHQHQLIELALERERIEAQMAELVITLKAKEDYVQQLLDQVQAGDRQISIFKDRISELEPKLCDERDRHRAELAELERKLCDEFASEKEGLMAAIATKNEQIDESLVTAQENATHSTNLLRAVQDELAECRSRFDSDKAEQEQQLRSQAEDLGDEVRRAKRHYEELLAKRERDSALELASAIERGLSEENLMRRQHAKQLREIEAEVADKSSLLEASLADSRERVQAVEAELKSLRAEHQQQLRAVDAKWKTLLEKESLKLESSHREELEGLYQEWQLEKRVPLSSGVLNSQELQKQADLATLVLESGDHSSELLRRQIMAMQTQMEVLKDRHRNEVSQLKEVMKTNDCPIPSFVDGGVRNQRLESLEIEYLKNILFEYMMGRERLTMAKVISAVVRFSEEQTHKVLEREERSGVGGQIAHLLK